MTDRELLEMAAKAAGLEIKPPPAWAEGEWEGLIVFRNGGLHHTNWNPLEDDSSALRLAVKLGMNLALVPGRAFAVAACGFDVNGAPNAEVVEPHADDPYAATRRAIVRAAAEIGRGMP